MIWTNNQYQLEWQSYQDQLKEIPFYQGLGEGNKEISDHWLWLSNHGGSGSDREVNQCIISITVN